MPRVSLSQAVIDRLAQVGNGYGIDSTMRNILGMEPLNPRVRQPRKPRQRRERLLSRAYPQLLGLGIQDQLVIRWALDPGTGLPVEGQSGPRRAVQRVGHRTGRRFLMEGTARGLVVTRIS